MVELLEEIQLGDIEVIEFDDEEIEDFVCHLYFFGSKTSHCGINYKQDAHAQMHISYNQKPPKFFEEGPEDSCPVCSAPGCPECLRIARSF